jgi:hypothetical protein
MGLGLLALEPRWMFDGAAAADAAHAAPDAGAKALIPAATAPVQVQAADPARTGGKAEVVFVDSTLANAKAIEAAQRPGVEVEEIDGGQSGLAQIAKWAETHAGYESITIIGHGTEAALRLGTDTVTSAGLADPVAQAEAAAIGSALRAGGELLIKADGVGRGTDGAQLAADLATATGATTGIFGDPTDPSGGDGNWTLDSATGAIEVQAADPALNGGRTEVVFIDILVPDYQTLIAGVKPGIEIELFGGAKDGLPQLAAWSATHSGYDSISILSHGGEGALGLGTSLIDATALADGAVRSELAQVGAALKADGDLRLYACDLAKGDDGRQFIADLGAATGRTVAASTDTTGHDGNWTLEYSTGAAPLSQTLDDGKIEGYGFNLDGYAAASSVTINSMTQSGANVHYSVTVTITSYNFTSNWDGAYFKITNSWGSNGGYFTWGSIVGTPGSRSTSLTSTYVFDEPGPTSVAISYSSTVSVIYVQQSQSSTYTTAVTGNTVFGSNFVPPPAISSATYSPATGDLVISGTNIYSNWGYPNVSSTTYGTYGLTLKGGNNQTYTLSSGDTVSNRSSTSVTIHLSAADQTAILALLDKGGTVSAEGTTYNLSATANWASYGQADATNPITVLVPTISGASYDAGTNRLTISGANFSTAASDYVLGDLTVTGGSGASYTLGNGDSVSTATATAVTINIASANQAALLALFDKGGTASMAGTTYNLAATAGWDTGFGAARATTAVTATDSVNPTLTHSGSATVTTESAIGWAAATIDNGTVTVSSTPNNWNGGRLVAAITSGADTSHDTLTIAQVGGITTSGSGAGALVYYNGAEIGTIKAGSTGSPGSALEVDFDSAAATNAAVAALVKAMQFSETGSGTVTTGSRTITFTGYSPYGGTATMTDTVTAGNYPTITGATYNAATGALTVSGVGMTTTASNFVPSLLTLKGDDGVSYALTTPTSAISAMSATGFTITLNAADKLAVNGLLDQNGTTAYSGTLYNLAASGAWDTSNALVVTTAGVTVSNATTPSIASVTYNTATHALVVTGSGIVNLGGTVGIDPTKLTLSGDNGVTYRLTSAASAVSAISATGFTITLNAADQAAIEPYLDASGTHPATNAGASYGLAAAVGWDTDASAATSAAVTVSYANHAPSLAATGGTKTFTEGGAAVTPFAGVSASIGALDLYTGQLIQSITLTVTNVAVGASEVLSIDGTQVAIGVAGSVTTAANGYSVTVAISSGTATVTIGKSVTNIAVADIAGLIQGITYQNSSLDPTTAARVITITGITDTGGTANGGTATAAPNISTTVNMVAVNNAPTVTLTPVTITTANTNISGATTYLPLSNTSVSPVEAAQTITGVTIKVTASASFDGSSEKVKIDGTWYQLTARSGTTTNGYAYSFVSSSGAWVITLTKSDSAANWTSLLQNFGYQDVAASPTAGTRTFAITAISDNGGTANGGVASASFADTTYTGSVTLVANDIPVVTVPAAQTLTATSQAAIAGLAVADSYSGSSISATVTSSRGTLSFTGSGITGNGSYSVTITAASVSALNTILATAKYTPTATTIGSDTIAVSVSDNGAAANLIGGNKIGTASFTVSLANPAPTLSLPAAQSDPTTGWLAISGTSISELFSGSTVTAILTVTNGAIDVTQGGGGATISGNDTTSVTVSGSVAAVNAALGTLKYRTSLAGSGVDAIVVTVKDDNSGAAATGSVPINVVGNDSPVVTVGGALTVGDTTAQHLTGISVADQFDSGNAKVTISASGILAATASGGAVVTNSGSSSLTIEGTKAAINATLANLYYTAPAASNASGDDTITIAYDDRGTTLVGGARSATAAIAVRLVANQAPVLTVPAAQTISDTAQHALAVTLSDGAAGGTVTATLSAGQGNLNLAASGAAAITGSGSRNVTITGSLSDVTNTLGSLKYAATATATGSDTVTISVNDGGTALIGGAKTASATIDITLAGNDAPVVKVPGAATVSTVDQISLQGFSVADTYGSGTLTALVTSAHGLLNFTARPGVTITDNDTGTVTITSVVAGNPAQAASRLNLVLATMLYTADTTATVDDVVTLQVSDGYAAGIGGARTGSNSMIVHLVAAAPPALTLPATQAAITDTAAHAITGISVGDSSNQVPSATYEATLSTEHGGTVSVDGSVAPTAGLSGNGSGSVTIWASSLGDLNAILATLHYTATSGVVSTTGDVIDVVVTANSEEIGEPVSASGKVAITLNANDTPAPVTVDRMIVSDTIAHAVTGVSITDSLGSATQYTATVSDSAGLLAMSAGAGTATIAGSGSTSVTITAASVADLNAALATLTYTATAGVSGTDTITLAVNDHGQDASLLGGDKAASVPVVQVAIQANEDPVLTAPGRLAISSSGRVAITGLSVSDPKTGGTVTAALAAGHGTIDVAQGGGGATITGSGGAIVTLSGSLADVNAALATLGYTTSLGATSSDGIAILVDDDGAALIGGARTASGFIAIDVLANTKPVLTVPGQQTITDTGSDAISGIAVADASTGASVTATVSALHGNLSLTASGAATIAANGTATVTVSGSLAEVNATLASLRYATTATATGNDTITVQVNDGGSALVGGAKSATATIAVTLLGNDAPSLTLVGAQYLSDTAAHALSGISVNDSYGGGTVTAHVSDAHGLLHVSAGAGLTLSGNDSTHLTLSGSLAAVNTALGTLTYAATSSGADTVTVTVNDGYSAGIGGALAASGTIGVTVFGNDMPVVSAGGPLQFSDTQAHAVVGVSVSDVYGAASATATVTAQSGILAVTAGSATVTHNGTGAVTISGSQAEVNAALATLTYASTATTSGSDTITISYSDNGTTLLGGAQTGTATIGVTLSANGTPTITVPGALSVTDRALHAISGVAVTDGDHAASMSATISALRGTLDLATGTGAAVIANNDSGTVTITGSLADINAALATLRYATTASATGADTVTVAVDDNAGSLIGGAKTGSASVAVTIGNAAAPVVGVGAAVADSTNGWTPVSGISVAETFAVASPTLTATISANFGILDLNAGAGGATISDNGGARVTIGGTQADLNAALATLRYRTTLSAGGTDAIAVTVTDSATALAGSGVQAINVIANDSPVVTAADAQTITDTASHAITGIVISDLAHGGTVSATLSATAGTLSVTAGGSTVTGNGSSNVTIGGSLAAVNAALASLRYTTTATATGSDTITIAFDDGGSGLVGGAKSASAVVGITLLGNQAPVISPPAAQNFGDSVQHAIAGLALSDAATGASVTATIADLHGTLHFTAGGGASISGNDSGNVIITGTLADVGNTLASLNYTTSASETASDTISVTVDDNGLGLIGGAKSATAAIQVALAGNGTPVVSVPGLQTIADTDPHAIAGISVTDSDAGGTVTCTVTATAGTLSFTGTGISGNGTATVTIAAAGTSALNTILGTLTYASTASGSASDTITIAIDDGNAQAIGGAKTGSNAFTIHLVANAAPVVSVPATQTITDTSPHALAGISVADSSVGTLTAIVSAASGGTLDGTGFSGGGTATLSVSGTLAQINAALATLTYTAADDGNGGALADVVTVTVNDGFAAAIGGAKSTSRAIAITLETNDAPSLAVPAALTLGDSGPHAVTGLVVTDGAGGTSYTATVSDGAGLLDLTAGSGTATIGGTATSRTITASTLADLNAALATLTYTATATASGDDTITVTVNDQGASNALVGGDKTGTATVGIVLLANDAPVIDLPGRQIVSTNSAIAISGLSVSDSFGGSSLSATVTAAHGTLSFTGSGISGNGSASVTVTAADATALNAILGTMRYTTTLATSGTDSIGVSVNDGNTAGIGGAKSATGTIEVSVSENRAPVVSGASQQTFTDTAAHAITGINVTDGDSAGSVTATLSAQHGTLTVTGAGVSGNGTGTVTVTGSLSVVNTILGTLHYAATATATTHDAITVSVNDNGTALVGGAKTGSAIIDVTLVGNDAPQLTTAGAQFFSDLAPHAITGLGVSDTYGGGTVTATISDGSGLLHIAPAAGLVITGNDTANVHLSGSLSAINTALGSLAYTATGSGGDTIAIAIDDGNTAAIGGAKGAGGTIAVTVFGNDMPVIVAPGGQTINDRVQHALTGLSAFDVYHAASVTATITARHGILDLGLGGGAATITNNDTATVTVSGSMADVNAALASLKYTSTRTNPGSDTITVTLDDGGSALVGGAKTAVATIGVIAAPTITGPAAGGIVGSHTPVVSGSGEPGTTVKVYDGARLVGTTLVDGNGRWSLTSATLANGAHTLTATATNAENVTSSALGSVALTLRGDALAAPSGAGGTQTSTSVPLQGGGAIPGSTVTIRDGATVVGQAVVDGSGNWSLTVNTTEGAHQFTVQQTDPSGNVGGISAPLGVTVSLPKPPPAAAPPAPRTAVESGSTTKAPAIDSSSLAGRASDTSSAIAAIRAVAGDSAQFTQGTQGGGDDAVAAKAAALGASGSGGFVAPLATPSVNAVRDGALFVQKGIPSLSVESAIIAFTVPADAFGHTESSASVQLIAKLSDGQPLPQWLSFDTARGTFVGEAPPGFVGALSVTVVARDNAGHEVATTFRIQVGGASRAIGEGVPAAAPRQTGKASFTQQLKLASRNAARRFA